MSSNFLPVADIDQIKKAYEAGDQERVFDMLVQPLHEELYKRQTFEFLDELSWEQQLLLTSDYMHMQVGQGGFIQFLQNGYVGLLPNMVEQFYKLGAPEMAQVLDDVLKVYVLNRELLEASTSVEDFAKLYDELKEFEAIDARYQVLNADTTQKMLEHAMANLHEFVRPA
ncbi:hypothetical protein GCM10023093_01210 [Nemorincola caseinilytica]|uniref:DNA mimic protein DMP19 C-terminal domain-containing protein n=1 Tax=Nemorincola caseinilytica TaxID=2054315 RepID=A0ABP8N1L4_9BACT